jgi:hypothetical protein
MRNVRPGDVDYPAQNLSPTRTVDLTIVDPPSIKIEVMIGYRAQEFGGPPNSGKECYYTQPFSTAPPVQYSVLTPLPLTRTGNLLSGKIVIDEYQPGRCGYVFAGVYYRELPFDENQDSNHELVFLAPNDASPISHKRADAWCWRPASRLSCASIELWPSLLPKDSPVTRAEADDITSKGGGSGPPVYLGPAVKSLLIQFHDLSSSTGNREILNGQ